MALLLLAGCASTASLLEHRGEGVTRFYEASFRDLWKAARTSIEANGLRLEEASEYHRYILAVHPPERGPGAPEDAVAIQSDQGERIGVFVDSVGPGRWAVEVVTRRRFPLDPNRLSWAEDIFWVIEHELGAGTRVTEPDTLAPGPAARNRSPPGREDRPLPRARRPRHPGHAPRGLPKKHRRRILLPP